MRSFTLYGFLGLGALAVALFVVIQMQRANIHELKAEVTYLEGEVYVRDLALENNTRELNECLDVNAANEAVASAQRAAAAAAAMRASILEHELNQALAQIHTDIEEFEDDQECRTLSDPLPVDFINRLRQ